MTDKMQLAGDFATPTWEEWEVEVLKVLNRKRPSGKELTIEQAFSRLRSTSVDGLVIEPLYTGYDQELGYPGVAPFKRGTTIKSGDMDAWDVRALHEDPDVAFTNQESLADLERGATSLWLRRCIKQTRRTVSAYLSTALSASVALIIKNNSS